MFVPDQVFTIAHLLSPPFLPSRVPWCLLAPSCGKALNRECVLSSNYHEYQLTRVDTFSVRPDWSLPSSYPSSPKSFCQLLHFSLYPRKKSLFLFAFYHQPNSIPLPFCLNMAYTPHTKPSFPNNISNASFLFQMSLAIIYTEGVK